MLVLLVYLGSQRMLVLLVGSAFFPVPTFLRGVRGDLNRLDLNGDRILPPAGLEGGCIWICSVSFYPSFIAQMLVPRQPSPKN